MSNVSSPKQVATPRSVVEAIFVPVGLLIGVRYFFVPLLALSIPNLDLESVYVNFVFLALAAVLISGGLYTVARSRGWSPADLSVRSVRLRAFLKIIPVYAAYFATLIVALIIAQEFISDEVLSEEQITGFEQVSGVWPLVVSGISLVVLAPLFEEFVFRGYMLSGLRARIGFWLSALITSGLFALAHGQLNVAIDTFIFGIALAYIVEQTKSIWPAVAMHAIKNAIAFSLIYLL